MTLCTKAQGVTNLVATYRNGQVFITFQHNAQAGTYFLLYRSSQPITSSSQLAQCEYLGMVHHESSKNTTLSSIDGVTRYFTITELGAPLTATTGLMVTTCVENKAFYYAVTQMTGGTEDVTIIPGSNALLTPVYETVASPKPVLQEKRLMSQNTLIDIYVQFVSSRVTVSGPLRFRAVSLGFCFAVNPGQLAAKPAPLYVNFHGGGSNFLANITSGGKKKILLNVSHHLPSGDVTAWLGCNQNYDVWNALNNTIPPSTGYNFFFTQTSILEAISFVAQNYQVDSSRIHLIGNSNGANGAFMLALVYPEKFASCEVSGGMYNFGFLNDYNPDCSMNEGKHNREDGNKRFGTVAQNLLEGTHMRGTYDLLNGPVEVHLRRETDFPIFKGLNGKNDKLMGWTEKVIWYDSVNSNRIGGYFFFDMREHGGEGRTWNSLPFEPERYSTKVSYPAFSYCSVNENPGTGTNASGDPVGSINGYLNWADPVVDQPDLWKVRIFMRNLGTLTGIKAAPDSCLVDVTPRRRQQFKPEPGTYLVWEVRHRGQIVHSGGFIYEGGLLTIPAVKVFKDTSELSISIAPAPVDTFYLDADGDGYGNPALWLQALLPPTGYVDNNLDCNDSLTTVHPLAQELCNQIDDDCDGSTDEELVVAQINPAGTMQECKGVKVTLEASSGTGYQYQWYRDGQILMGSTQQTYTVNGNQSGSYQVQITIVGNCQETSPATHIVRIDKPKASIKVQGDLNICQTGSVTLKAKDGTGTQWQWYKNDVAIAGATQQSYVATETGQYKVQVIEPILGCSKTSKAVQVTSTCRERLIPVAEVSVSPNPASDVVYLKIQNDTGSESKAGSIELLGINGQCLMQRSITLSEPAVHLEMSVEKLPDGMYFLHLRFDGSFQILPIVINR
ncbi:MAG: MopE-related protein [Chitinophagales bacterium]|nr:MopE-related protein [Chitinophagales bacterium]MDW8427604.1 MopE-related protein [Chitinophagales bacterium]